MTPLWKRDRALRLFLTLLLSAFATGNAAAQTAPAVPDARIERFTDHLTEMLPIGVLLDEAASKDLNWPITNKVDTVSKTELACLREELSSQGLRKTKLAEVRSYAVAQPDRFDDDLKLLDTSVGLIFGKIVLAGSTEQRTGIKADPGAIIRNATPEQLIALTSFMHEPRYKPLREISGLGDLFDQARSTDESRRQGIAIGFAHVTKLVMRAMGTCGIPFSKTL